MGVADSQLSTEICSIHFFFFFEKMRVKTACQCDSERKLEVLSFIHHSLQSASLIKAESRFP